VGGQSPRARDWCLPLDATARPLAGPAGPEAIAERRAPRMHRGRAVPAIRDGVEHGGQRRGVPLTDPPADAAHLRPVTPAPGTWWRYARASPAASAPSRRRGRRWRAAPTGSGWATVRGRWAASSRRCDARCGRRGRPNRTPAPPPAPWARRRGGRDTRDARSVAPPPPRAPSRRRG